MAQQGGIPKWLIDSKEHISRSPEWANFIEELHGAIEQQLKESHVESFSDLKHAERELFMLRAAKAIQGGNSYSNMYSKVSVSLDQHMNNEVARQLLEDFPINTKTDLILDCAQDGAVNLLRKWPDMKSKLHITFNQPLPTGLRQLSWKLFLDDTQLRHTYVNLLKSNPRAAISPLDLEISQRVERLVLAEPTFVDLKGSIGAFYAMKATLSYHHALMQTRDSLIDVDYFLVAPFVASLNNTISRKDPAPSHIVATLVVEYLTFMDTRPGFVIDSGSPDHNKEFSSFVEKVVDLLKREDKMRTAKSLAERFAPSKDKIIATEAGKLSILGDGLAPLLRPIIRCMFVGYVKMEVALFIWDQYMIGRDCPGFHDAFLPRVAAIFLMLLNSSIRNAPPDQSLGSVLKENGIRLTVPQFQYEIHKYFFKDLFAMLNQENRAAVPVLDPTQSLHPPWMHCFKDVIPGRTTPQDRRAAREERESERHRLLLKQQDKDRQKYMDQIVAKTRDEADLLKVRDEERDANARMQHDLEAALEAERLSREHAQREAVAEIERLRREIEALKQARPSKTRGSDISSRLDSRISRYLIPPPPTRASHPPTPIRVATKLPSPTPAPRRSPGAPLHASPKAQTEDTVKRFIAKISGSFRVVAQGSGREVDELDEETKLDIKEHRVDIKHAEKSVFGRELRPGEFERLDAGEQDEKANELMDAIKERLQQRRRDELKAGQR